jgi:hypothetical protein
MPNVYSYEQTWEAFEFLLKLKLPAKEAWNRLIFYLESVRAKEIWQLLRSLEMEAEQENFSNWFESVFSGSPIPASVKALFVGITKVQEEDMPKEMYVIYVIGSDKYDKNNIYWALDPTFEPENNVGLLEIMNQIDDVIQGDTDQQFLDWILPLAYCAFMLDEIIRTKLNKSIFLKNTTKINVTTGFEDGDYANLSPIE